MLFPEHKIQLFPETEDADVEMKSSASAELLELAQRTETCKQDGLCIRPHREGWVMGSRGFSATQQIILDRFTYGTQAIH